MSKQTDFDKLDILGVEIDVLTIPEAVQYIIDHSAPSLPAGYAVKPYVEFLDRAYRDFEIQQVLNDADIAIADGIALTWAAAYLYAGPRTTWRWLKTIAQIVFAPHELRWPLTDRAAGINFTLPLLEAAAKAGRSVMLVSTPRTTSLEHTADAIHQLYPTLTIAGLHTGTDPDANATGQSRPWLDELARAITASGADIILLGLGFPRQELAAAYLAEHLRHGILVGEGGTFDYTALGGRRRKAPRVLQRSGLEWLWRLILEPSRLKRQLAIPRFMYRVWRVGQRP